MRDSSVKVFGHPVHPMLIVFPLGLLATAVIFDVAYLATSTAYLSEVAYWMVVAGLLGGLVAAPFGLLDWLAIPAGTHAKRIGVWHGIGNGIVVMLFALSWYVRSRAVGPCCFSLRIVVSWCGTRTMDRVARW
jgi:uncharacterized membrane protein